MITMTIQTENQRSKQLDISQQFDIILSILKASTNSKYRCSMLNRIKRLSSDIFGQFDIYEELQRKSKRKYDKMQGDRTKC